MTTKLITTLLLCMVFNITFVNGTSLEGDWELIIKTPQGDRVEEVTITKEGEKYFGKEGDSKFEIEVDDNQINFTKNMSTPMGEIDMKFEGELDGDNMEGVATLTSGPMADQQTEWSAVKQ